MLDPSPNLLVHGERLEIRDNLGCAIWKNLGYSEWSTPAGLKFARENLQSRVKEDDSISDVENAIFDLGVMDSLCLESVIQFVRPGGTVFAHGPFKNSFQATIGYLNLPTCLWVIRGGETMSDSIFKHDLYKLVIAKMGSAITYDCTRGTKSREERFKKFANYSGVVGGERFCFNPFQQVIDDHDVLELRSLSCWHSELVGNACSFSCRDALHAKSACINMSSQGKSQSGAIKIGASVNFLLSVLKDSIHSLREKWESLFKQVGSYWIGTAVLSPHPFKRLSHMTGNLTRAADLTNAYF
ncbi:hypothetical protein Tco_0803444 [Tanacetum coccineum]|uniref:Uncharacterized protein n=1 Tax=Tanacetum coccineum TaxID=301880 RepID=A0ABQ5A416_9ASTR